MMKKAKTRRKFLAFLMVTAIMFENPTQMVYAEEISSSEIVTNNDVIGNSEEIFDDEIVKDNTSITGDEVDDNNASIAGDEVDDNNASITGDEVDDNNASITGDEVDDNNASIAGDEVDDNSASIIGDKVDDNNASITGDEVDDNNASIIGDEVNDNNSSITGDDVGDNTGVIDNDEVGNISKSEVNYESSDGSEAVSGDETLVNETLEKVELSNGVKMYNAIEVSNTDEVSEKKQQFTTSDGVNVEVTFNKSTRTLEVFYDITENAEGDIVIELSELIPFLEENYRYIGYGFGNGGSYGASNINITTSNGHTYKYKDGSFVLETQDLSDSENFTDFVGFDGQNLPAEFIGNVVKAEPILDLYKGEYTKSSLKAYHLVDIYDRLEKKGYTGDNALTNYLLDYYNKKLGGTTYSTINDLYNEHPEVLITGDWRNPGMLEANNTSVSITEEQYKELEPKIKDNPYVVIWENGDQYYIQYKWPDEQLAAFSYEFFYANVLKLYFGDKEKLDELCKGNASNLKENNLKDYMDSQGDSEGIWAEVNQYLNEATKLGLTKEEQAKLAIYMAFGFNGDSFANTYQDYVSSWYNSITLEQIDGDVTINKVDENGELITEPTTFNLYYYTMEVDQEESNKIVTYYYAIDENGSSYFTTDVTKAAALITEDGSLTVKYLLPDYNYYLKEVVAPEGYELNSEEIQFKITSKETTIISVQNKKIEDSENPKDESTENPEDESTENPKDESTENPEDESTENPKDESTENPKDDSIENSKEDSTERPKEDDYVDNLPMCQTMTLSTGQTLIVPEVEMMIVTGEQTVTSTTNQVEIPRTGDDSSNPINWMVIFIIAGVTMAILFKKQVKRN